MTEAVFRSGFVTVFGRPNTGKSTLVNTLVGQKISIVTSKPQTTRHRILGIATTPASQIIYIDTPGLQARSDRLLNRAMNRAATASLAGADLALLVIEGGRWKPADDYALRSVIEAALPCILVVNKVDRIRPRSDLLPFLRDCAGKADFVEIVPASGLRGDNIDRLAGLIRMRLPQGELLFDENTLTDRSVEFRVAEAVREKLLENLHAEVPYGIAVEIAAMERRDDLLLAEATIWIEKESHKGIVIGRGGERLKKVGQGARADLEEALALRVHLETRVRVKENWSDNAHALRQLGYEVPH